MNIPKKPSVPKKPKEVITCKKIVWSSNEKNVKLSDILNQIPQNIHASDILISTNKINDELITTISYLYDIPNIKLDEQFKEYYDKYEIYQEKIKEWQLAKQEYDNLIKNIDEIVSSSFDAVA